MHIITSDSRTFRCTRQVLENMQWPVCHTCACKCEESQEIRSLHIFTHTLVIGLTAQLHKHIRQSHVYMHKSSACSDPCVWRVHVNVKKVRKCAHYTFSRTHRSLSSLPNYINTSDSRTFTCTRQVLVNVQWPVCLTCACRCEESQKILLLHNFMHISVTGPTVQLHEHIGQSDHCTFTCTHQVHVNVQRHVCLTCACKCAESEKIGWLHIFMHTSVFGLTAQLIPYR